MNIFDRARLLVAQSKSPTTLRAQLAKLGRRKRRSKVNIAKERAKAPVQYWWNDGP